MKCTMNGSSGAPLTDTTAVSVCRPRCIPVISASHPAATNRAGPGVASNTGSRLNTVKRCGETAKNRGVWMSTAGRPSMLMLIAVTPSRRTAQSMAQARCAAAPLA